MLACFEPFLHRAGAFRHGDQVGIVARVFGGFFDDLDQAHRPLEDFVQLLDVGHAFGFGEREELLVQCLMGDEHFVGRELVVERQGRAVLDAVGDGIFVQVALVVLAAEDLEGALAVDGLVDRGAGKADICGDFRTLVL